MTAVAPEDRHGSIQRLRNRIEHRRYDHNEKEDDTIIASSLKFILYFVEFVFERKLDGHIDPKILRDINNRVFDTTKVAVSLITASTNGQRASGRAERKRKKTFPWSLATPSGASNADRTGSSSFITTSQLGL